MKTLKECVIEYKCRKGAAAGTTKDGAFWVIPCYIKNNGGDGCLIRAFGGDGIGNSAPNCDNYLTLRHFRDGTVQAVVRCHSWHQNHGTRDTYVHVPFALGCCTVEDVIVALKRDKSDEAPLFSDTFETELTEWLTSMELLARLPGPDEVK